MKKLFLISLLIGNVAWAEMNCVEVKKHRIDRCETKFQTHTEVCYVILERGISCFTLQNQSAVN